MDTSNWSTQGPSGAVGDSMESGDWRAQLQPDSRQRIVNKITDTLKRHLPFSGHEGLQELEKIAVRFEEKIYTVATSQNDYLRKISLKMLTMETRSENSMPDAMQEMDTSNWRPTQVPSDAVGDSMEYGDWRAQLQADSRQRIVNKIIDTMKSHPLFSGHEGLQELKKIAVRFEEKIYTAATSQSDYLRKIALEMLTLETTRSQNPMPDAMQANSAANSLNPSDPASLDSTAQTGNPNGGDWQEEVYQKIKAMKDLYLLDLNDIHQKIIGKLSQETSIVQHDSLPQQPKNGRLEKLKAFKNMLECFMQFLQIPKHGLLADYKDKLGTYEKQIVYVVNACRRKPAPIQQQQQALPPPHIHSMQHSQFSQLTQVPSHDNQMNLQGSMASNATD